MARYKDSVCRLCRREGLKLFLKGDRCYTEKCAIERREYAPGQHGQSRRSKPSEFGVQMREKQKMRTVFGMLERQFRKTFAEAERSKGVTGTRLLQMLETRMDNLVYRGGFANSRNEARQLIRHRHFLVNDKKVNIPSARLKPGDVIAVNGKSREVVRIQGALNASERRGIPEWLELQRDAMKVVIRALPSRDQISTPINENLIVEYYSK